MPCRTIYNKLLQLSARHNSKKKYSNPETIAFSDLLTHNLQTVGPFKGKKTDSKQTELYYPAAVTHAAPM